MQKNKSLIFIIAVCFLAIPILLPLLHAGFFPMHDDTQVARVYEMGNALAGGQFPVRWVQDLGYGYGYPIFTFYAPLAYYIGAFFSFATTALIGTKLMIAFAVVMAGIGMYLLGSSFWGKWGGLVSAIFYMYAPYHALDIYVRGDLAENLAYACIPFIFYGLYRFARTRNARYFVLAAVSYALVIASHNLTAMMITPFVLATAFVLLFTLKKKQGRHLLLGSIGIGILLAGFYWLPALTEIRFTNVLGQIVNTADFHKHFVCLSQLWNSPWGFGGSAPGCVDGMSFRLGKLHVLFILIGLLSMFFMKKRKEYRGVIIFALGGFLISILFTLQISAPIWNLIKPMAFLQYPWRFLIMTSLFSSFLAGSIVTIMQFFLKDKTVKLTPVLLAGVSILGTIILYTKLFQPQRYLPTTNKAYTSQDMLTWHTSKISDEYMPQGFQKPQNPLQRPIKLMYFTEGRGTINDIVLKPQSKSMTIAVPVDSLIHITIAPFPAWMAFDSGKALPLTSTRTGYTFHLSPGTHHIQIRYIETLVEKTGDILTLLGIVGLIAGIIYIRKTTYEKAS